ncbi:MAG: Na+/H+ antiporter subunit E [Thermoflexales bacterium]|nr:Na+/H+ antiporter subunit E [Thermoflexales bacterium]
MTFLMWNIALALVWAALWGFNALNLLVGFILGYGLMSVARRAFPPTSYFNKVGQVVRFLVFFLYELVVASVQIAGLVLKPRLDIHPGVVAVPLDARTHFEVMLVANLISLTPGTLSLELSPDDRVLYVHGIDVRDGKEFVRKIKSGLEARALEVAR